MHAYGGHGNKRVAIMRPTYLAGDLHNRLVQASELDPAGSLHTRAHH